MRTSPCVTRRTAGALLSLLILASLVVPAVEARMKMARHEFRVGEWIHIGLDLDGVVLEDVKFHGAPKLKGAFTRHDKPNRATIVARNNTNVKQDAGACLAVFDRDGRLLAAGNTGTSTGVLQPGERHEFDVHFAAVYREIDKASYFLIALEY